MTLAVISAAEGASWEASLLAALGQAPGAEAIAVVRRCVDVVELLAVAGSGQAVAALVDAHLRRLDADVVERLDASGVAVVGVTGPGLAEDTERLLAAGINFFVPADAPAAVFAAVVQSAVAQLSGKAGSGHAFGDPAFATGSLAGEGQPSPAPNAIATAQPVGVPAGSGSGQAPRPPAGTVIAVWGPTGAPGRSTTAVSLADELARLGKRSLFIDADVYGGVAAAMFGLLDESPGLVAACRQAQSRRLDVDALAGLCWQISSDLRVLTGISRADRWPEIRSTALQSVVTVARELVEYTVIDLGFSLETDEELSFDTMAPRRNGATLAALEESDLILAVGSADPIGMQRLVRGLGELRALDIGTPIRIVLNRVRRSAVSGDPAAELNATLQRFVGQSCAALLPYDLAALDHAAVAGQTLAEAAPTSTLRCAVTELARSICGVQAPKRGRRRS